MLLAEEKHLHFGSEQESSGSIFLSSAQTIGIFGHISNI